MREPRALLMVLAIGLAWQDLPILAWPILLGALYLLRPQWGYLVLLLLTIPRWPQWQGTLAGWGESWGTRWQSRQPLWGASIQIWPARIFEDRPQTWFLFAPHSRNLKASWLEQGGALTCESLGRGVFRLRFVPGSPAMSPSPLSYRTLLLESDGDGSSAQQLQRVLPWARPAELVSIPQLGLGATVSQPTDELVVVDRTGACRRFPVGDGPTACQFLPGGQQLVVATRYSGSVDVVDLTQGKVVRSIPVGEPVENLAVDPQGRWLALLTQAERGSLRLWKLPSLEPLADLKLPQPGEYLTFVGDELVVASRVGRCLFRAGWTPARGWTLSERARPLARPAFGLCAAPDGRRVYLTTTSPQLRGGFQAGNHFVSHCILTLDLKRWFFLPPRITQAGSREQNMPGAMDSGCGPEGLNLDEQGNLLVAFSGSHEVATLPRDPEELEIRQNLVHENLFCPRSVADLGGAVRLVSYPAQGLLAWLDYQGRVISRLELAPGTGDEMVRQGEIGFYEATQSGVACQSCHPGGDSDYSRHDIGGARPWGTLTSLGVEKTAPYLRNGSYARLQDLHQVTESVYRGFRRATAHDRSQALAAYLNTLPEPYNPVQVGLEQQRRGLETFFEAGCVECHSWPALTNRASVLNQQLFPKTPMDYCEWLDVPSLRGLWRSAPYLHDERAASLREVLTRQNEGDCHGRTGSLSSQQLDDLEAFLRCL